jgi:hypothetical protein
MLRCPKQLCKFLCKKKKQTQKTTTMQSPETQCMPITQAGQSRRNKRFLSGKQIQQFSIVLDTCLVLSIFFHNCV